MKFDTRNEIAMAKAVGRGDYRQVISLCQKNLNNDPEDYWSLLRIGYCYEQLENNDAAKKYYSSTLAIDPINTGAIEGMARIFASEKNHEVAYQYVVRGIDSVIEENHSIPSWVKFLLSLILKILKLRTPFTKIKEQVYEMDSSRSDWLTWARSYREWYENNFGKSNEPTIH